MEDAFNRIPDIKGVKGFVAVDQSGQLSAHTIDDPEATVAFVLACTRHLDASGNSDFKYLLFKRSCKENFFVFPVGNSYLGVLKQEGVGDFTLANTIMNYIHGLPEKYKSPHTLEKKKQKGL